jgi:hypothetical protein
VLRIRLDLPGTLFQRRPAFRSTSGLPRRHHQGVGDGLRCHCCTYSMTAPEAGDKYRQENQNGSAAMLAAEFVDPIGFVLQNGSADPTKYISPAPISSRNSRGFNLDIGPLN